MNQQPYGKRGKRNTVVFFFGTTSLACAVVAFLLSTAPDASRANTLIISLLALGVISYVIAFIAWATRKENGGGNA